MSSNSLSQLTPEESINRAFQAASQKALYRLGYGGRDPRKPTPFTTKTEKATGRTYTAADCMGFVLWCLGIDRYQPKAFPYYDGWINTDSSIADARGKKALFEFSDRPELGGLVVFPGIADPKTGKRKRIGHAALIVGVPAEWPDPIAWKMLAAKERTKLLKQVRVIDCSASKLRAISGWAIKETTAAASWDKPDAVFMRFKGFARS